MSRELIAILWCDGHRFLRDQKQEATDTRLIALDGDDRPRIYDHCADPDCANIGLGDLILLYPDLAKAEASQVKPPKKRTARRGLDYSALNMRVCPDCDYVAPSRGALSQHLEKHGTKLSDYSWPASDEVVAKHPNA